MKYMLLITQSDWYANGSAADRDKAMEKVVAWWGEQFASGRMVGGRQLKARNGDDCGHRGRPLHDPRPPVNRG